MENTLFLRRESKLSQFKTSDSMYYQEKIDYESDGEAFETFDKKQGMIGVLTNLTPHWDHTKNQWSFYGSFADLKRICDKLRLSNKKTGKTVEVNESSIYNKLDDFFNHEYLWTSTFMQDNSKILSTDGGPLEEFYMRVLKGRDDIKQPGSEKIQSSFDTDKNNFILTSPGQETREKKVVADELKEAWKEFLKLEKNFDKLKRIVAIMDPPGFNDSYNDQTALQTLVTTSIIENDEMDGRYGMSPRKYFTYLAKLDNAELDIYSIVFSAKNFGMIRVKRTGATLNGEPIGDGLIKTDKDLINFYLQDKNAKAYLELVALVEERDKTKNGGKR